MESKIINRYPESGVRSGHHYQHADRAMTNRIIGPECPHCGRDNRGYADVCTSDACEAAMANHNRQALT